MRVILINVIWFMLTVNVPRLVHGVYRRRHFSFRSRRLPSIIDGVLTHGVVKKKLPLQKREIEVIDIESVFGNKKCCGSVTEWISPRGGVSRNGELLEINSDSRYQQIFQQTRCLPEVENRQCRNLSPSLRRASRCVQKHEYRLAMVTLYDRQSDPKLDFFRINSSCSCEVIFEANRR